MARKSISKKRRFEIFKRDKFTCQYCGAVSPDVILHVDHITPVKEGGGDDILNLVTACAGCNLGKGATRLDDQSELKKQQALLVELEERRQQIEMLLDWRKELHEFDNQTVDRLGQYISDRWQFPPNQNGCADLKKWMGRYTFQELIEAIEASFQSQIKYSGDKVTEESWNLAFAKIPAFATIARQGVDKPYMRDLYYIRGILKNRFGELDDPQWLARLERIHLAGITLEYLTKFAKSRGADEYDFLSEVVSLVPIETWE